MIKLFSKKCGNASNTPTGVYMATDLAKVIDLVQVVVHIATGWNLIQ